MGYLIPVTPQVFVNRISIFGPDETNIKEKKKKTPNGPAIPKGDHRKLNVSSENEAFSSQTSINAGPNSC